MCGWGGCRDKRKFVLLEVDIMLCEMPREWCGDITAVEVCDDYRPGYPTTVLDWGRGQPEHFVPARITKNKKGFWEVREELQKYSPFVTMKNGECWSDIAKANDRHEITPRDRKRQARSWGDNGTRVARWGN